MSVLRRSKSFRNVWSKALPYLLILPVVLYYGLFWARPVLRTVIQSFQDVAGQFTLQNYALVFSDPDFIPALRNTAIIVVFSVTLEFLAALFLARINQSKIRRFRIFLICGHGPNGTPRSRGGRDVVDRPHFSWMAQQLAFLLGVE